MHTQQITIHHQHLHSIYSSRMIEMNFYNYKKIYYELKTARPSLTEVLKLSGAVRAQRCTTACDLRPEFSLILPSTKIRTEIHTNRSKPHRPWFGLSLFGGNYAN